MNCIPKASSKVYAAQPMKLLKFQDGAPLLVPEGLELIRSLQAPVYPIVFIGDGRSGKSHLASSALLQCDPKEDCAFVSGNSAKPVTEGIDVQALRHADGDALIFDCEGGNNALGAMRTLVNVFGTLIGTQIVFVANSMASEDALRNLGTSLAARDLIRRDEATPLPCQQLVFVVNMTMLDFKEEHFKELLAEHEDSGRNELRLAIKDAFPERSFVAMPIKERDPEAYKQSLAELRKRILTGAAPLTMGGAEMSGAQLEKLLLKVKDEIEATKEVQLPSMIRYMIFDNFLLPLISELQAAFETNLPVVTDYEPQLCENESVKETLQRFDDHCSHLTRRDMVDEARSLLQNHLDKVWIPLLERNELFGHQVRENTVEVREVHLFTRVEQIGCAPSGLMSVSKNTFKIQSRVRIVRKRSSTPEYSEWTDTGTEGSRIEAYNPESKPESKDVRAPEVVQGVPDRALPEFSGHLWKKSRPEVSSCGLQGLIPAYTRRYFALRNMHLLWWKSESSFRKGDVSHGCINLLVHRATLEVDYKGVYGFTLRPTDDGWHSPWSFNGGSERCFSFSSRGSEHSRQKWVKALDAHMKHAQSVFDTFGAQWVYDEVKVKNLTLGPQP